jgi:hypothetical protein
MQKIIMTAVFDIFLPKIIAEMSNHNIGPWSQPNIHVLLCNKEHKRVLHKYKFSFFVKKSSFSAACK